MASLKWRQNGVEMGLCQNGVKMGLKRGVKCLFFELHVPECPPMLIPRRVKVIIVLSRGHLHRFDAHLSRQPPYAEGKMVGRASGCAEGGDFLADEFHHSGWVEESFRLLRGYGLIIAHMSIYGNNH